MFSVIAHLPPFILAAMHKNSSHNRSETQETTSRCQTIGDTLVEYLGYTGLVQPTNLLVGNIETLLLKDRNNEHFGTITVGPNTIELIFDYNKSQLVQNFLNTKKIPYEIKNELGSTNIKIQLTDREKIFGKTISWQSNEHLATTLTIDPSQRIDELKKAMKAFENWEEPWWCHLNEATTMVRLYEKNPDNFANIKEQYQFYKAKLEQYELMKQELERLS